MEKTLPDLNPDLITFGKYKNNSLSDVLKDRSYCIWLSQQDWFEKNYPYLYNRVSTYDPLNFFIKNIKNQEENCDFMTTYKFFNLKNIENIKLDLNSQEKSCYKYYLKMVEILKHRILQRQQKGEENIYSIKAPVKWLQKFEKETSLKRKIFKEFIGSYELPNIPYIIERIKKEGGIVYKGAQSFNIAKARSLDQENWWEKILKDKYGENIGSQFQYKKCIFDFLNISTNIIFECKLSLNDFKESQHKKYKMTLGHYKIIYLIAKDCLVDIEKKILFTTNEEKYSNYLYSIEDKSKPSYLDIIIKNFNIFKVEDISTVLG
jgi:hypothetical protein